MSYRLDRLAVLVVDDNRHMLGLISEILRGLGIRDLVMLTDAATAFREIKITAVDVVITDHAMSPISGIEFVTMLRTSDDSPDRFVPVIMVTGYSDL
ncbi:MAG: response regulator, partial [Alphaproteobacteria bacterium]|nr:response regulator [Alphaproteobacteria bacterium]